MRIVAYVPSGVLSGLPPTPYRFPFRQSQGAIGFGSAHGRRSLNLCFHGIYVLLNDLWHTLQNKGIFKDNCLKFLLGTIDAISQDSVQPFYPHQPS